MTARQQMHVYQVVVVVEMVFTLFEICLNFGGFKHGIRTLKMAAPISSSLQNKDSKVVHI